MKKDVGKSKKECGTSGSDKGSGEKYRRFDLEPLAATEVKNINLVTIKRVALCSSTVF